MSWNLLSKVLRSEILNSEVLHLYLEDLRSEAWPSTETKNRYVSDLVVSSPTWDPLLTDCQVTCLWTHHRCQSPSLPTEGCGRGSGSGLSGPPAAAFLWTSLSASQRHAERGSLSLSRWSGYTKQPLLLHWRTHCVLHLLYVVWLSMRLWRVHWFTLSYNISLHLVSMRFIFLFFGVIFSDLMRFQNPAGMFNRCSQVSLTN